jgi:hypothetical protein
MGLGAEQAGAAAGGGAPSRRPTRTLSMRQIIDYSTPRREAALPWRAHWGPCHQHRLHLSGCPNSRSVSSSVSCSLRCDPLTPKSDGVAATRWRCSASVMTYMPISTHPCPVGGSRPRSGSTECTAGARRGASSGDRSSDGAATKRMRPRDSGCVHFEFSFASGCWVTRGGIEGSFPP